ncbi:Ribosomal protein 60S [Mycena kentingensis (nom. inval.)]|nr:Ribosomal protein 60S [Mycena kentingensis (nom. inval.)]
MSGNIRSPFVGIGHNPPLLQKAPLVEDDLSLDDFTMPIPHAVPARVARPTPPRTPHTKRESISLSSVAIPMPDSDTEPDFDALDAPQVRAGSPDITSILATTPQEDFIDDYGKQRDTIYSVSSKANKHFTFGFPRCKRLDDNQDSDSDLDLHTSLPTVVVNIGNIHVALVAFPFIRTRSFAFWPWFISLRNTDDAQFFAQYANNADV